MNWNLGKRLELCIYLGRIFVERVDEDLKMNEIVEKEILVKEDNFKCWFLGGINING